MIIHFPYKTSPVLRPACYSTLTRNERRQQQHDFIGSFEQMCHYSVSHASSRLCLSPTYPRPPLISYTLLPLSSTFLSFPTCPPQSSPYHPHPLCSPISRQQHSVSSSHRQYLPLSQSRHSISADT
ncbi:hypothetical protein E2C01_091097 [Portunus trituberculatus]|uniref:Uncharacterized protein n=1 Tax=Portunus trituberculatus TaxID=210409 RepID=A0A5B7JS36_PORTR|nr:hypothetical protein [Portunus trituberculatus]